MAAPLDDMFSFCVDPGKVAACVEARFIDNVKVRRWTVAGFQADVLFIF